MKKLVALFLTLTMLVALPAGIALAEDAPYEFSVMTNFSGNPSEIDKAWIAGIEEKLNIKVNFISPAASAYGESLQIMLASGDYVDLVLYTSSADKSYAEAVRNGLYIATNDLLPNYPNIMAYTSPESFEELKIMKDENIYGVPRSTVTRADGFAIRQDWLDNLGIPFPEDGILTVAQLEEILYAFTFKDPDGNGKNDTYGFTNYSTNGTMEPLFQWTYGMLGWQEYDGEYMNLQYSREHDNFKRCLALNQKLWTEGLLDPDWPTINSAVMIDRLDSGITGMAQRFAGHMSNDVIKGAAINPNYKLSYVTGIIENEEDRDSYVGARFTTGLWGLWAISSLAEKPEKIMEFLDYMLSDEGWPETAYGPEGITWNMVDGEMVATDQYDAAIISRNFARRSGDASFFVHINTDAELRATTIARIQTCVDQCIPSLDFGYKPEVTNDPTYIDYVKYMNTEIGKIITGARPVDDWDEILDGWYEAGGDQYVSEMQAYIQASQSK